MTLDLSGLAVALATPFKASGEVDVEAFRRLVRHVVAGGVDVLIPLGSTGEAATLEASERDLVITTCLEEAGGRPVRSRGGLQRRGRRVRVRLPVRKARRPGRAGVRPARGDRGCPRLYGTGLDRPHLAGDAPERGKSLIRP